MPNHRADIWLTALALALFVALMALIANAQPQATSPDVDQILAVESQQIDPSQWILLRWQDGRQTEIKLSSIQMVRKYPPGHEGGHPTLTAIDFVLMAGQQRVYVDPDIAKALDDWGEITTLAAWDSDGKRIDK